MTDAVQMLLPAGRCLDIYVEDVRAVQTRFVSRKVKT